MSLGYFSQLTDKEKIDLLNFCIIYKNRSSKRNEQKIPYLISTGLWKETDTIDSNGQRYRIIKTPSGEFMLNDFYIYRKDDNKPQLNAEFSSQLRMFMTTRFGKAYCDALYLAHMQEAEEERKNTRSYRNFSRKGY